MIKRLKIKLKFNIRLNKYDYLLIFFWWLFFVLIIRLFYLQIIKYNEYNDLLFSEHYSVANLEPVRWNIYLQNKNGWKIALTDNINLYTLYADPYIIWNNQKAAKLLAPILYKHFCDRYKLDKVDKYTCVKNVEKFAKVKLIKQKEKAWTWDLTNTSLAENIDLSYITTWILQNDIEGRLENLLKKSYITKAYLWFFSNPKLIKSLKNLWLNALIFQDNNYVYVNLNQIDNLDRYVLVLHNILSKVNNKYTKKYLIRILNKRPRRYVKIADYVNPVRIDKIKQLKKKYKWDKNNKIPLLHWIWFQKHPFRYYPYNSFLSHVLWYVNNGNGVWWIEQYYNNILKWKEWKIIWMNTPWIWTIWSTSTNVQQAQNWANIYLTIDYSLQKQVQNIIKKAYYQFKADNVSVVIMNPFNWEVKAMASYPNFNPNDWEQIYKIKPLTKKYDYLITGNMAKTYINIPILVEKKWKLVNATFEDRFNPKLKKYIFKNLLWPRTFINQVISDPYEPWSIFKVLTVSIGVDSRNISLYDYYTDKWKIKIWPYTIRNVARECVGYHTFLHALERSCNVWMVKLIKKVWKDIYYNYLKELWFWKRTWIQLAWEKAWQISALEHFSKARFYNNSFGQWILVTPMQMAVTVSAVVNWWFLLKPTIVKKIVEKNTVINFGKYIVSKVFDSTISKDMIYALYSTIYHGDLIRVWIKNYTLWWKTWTSQLTFRWRYQKSIWWTNWSFVWIVTADNLKYVIAVKVSRPRSCQWWVCTAWKIYKNIAKSIIEYDGIKK